MSSKDKHIPKPPATKERLNETFEKGQRPDINGSRLPTSELNPQRPQPKPRDPDKK